MKALVVYDSVFGNTEKVARAIAEALGCEAKRVGETKPEDLKGVELLVVGSPTRAFSPTPATTAFIKSIPATGLAGVMVAGFDTGFERAAITSGFLKLMVGLFGYAAPKIAKSLEKKGGKLAAAAEGFWVLDSEGPLKDGELARASVWAKILLAQPARAL